MNFYLYQRSMSFFDLGPNHSDSKYLTFFSSITFDFNISSALTCAIQNQWSSVFFFVFFLLLLLLLLFFTFVTFMYSSFAFFSSYGQHKWVNWSAFSRCLRCILLANGVDCYRSACPLAVFVNGRRLRTTEAKATVYLK